MPVALCRPSLLRSRLKNCGSNPCPGRDLSGLGCCTTEKTITGNRRCDNLLLAGICCLLRDRTDCPRNFPTDLSFFPCLLKIQALYRCPVDAIHWYKVLGLVRRLVPMDTVGLESYGLLYLAQRQRIQGNILSSSWGNTLRSSSQAGYIRRYSCIKSAIRHLRQWPVRKSHYNARKLPVAFDGSHLPP